MPERNPHFYATRARAPWCTMEASEVAGRKIKYVLAKRNDVRIGPLEHAQVDRLRRRYVRQAQTACARSDGDPPGAGGRGVCRSAQKARHSHRPERCVAEKRADRSRTGQEIGGEAGGEQRPAQATAQSKDMMVV